MSNLVLAILADLQETLSASVGYVQTIPTPSLKPFCFQHATITQSLHVSGNTDLNSVSGITAGTVRLGNVLNTAQTFVTNYVAVASLCLFNVVIMGPSYS